MTITHIPPSVMRAAFRHITVPTDGSSAAETGVSIALDLAAPDGSITFCSVVDSTLVSLPAAQGTADADVFCGLAQAQATERGLNAYVRVLHGECVDAVDSLVRHSGSNAIVIGTHGRSGIARGLLGSVTEGLLRHSDVPVIAVHAGDNMRTGPIAVAIDESQSSKAALDTAIAIAVARCTSLTLIHVFDGADRDEVKAGALLTNAAERAHLYGLPATLIRRKGAVAEEVLAASDDSRCSMIAIGTHGRGFVTRSLLGSVALAVIRHAHVPVVAVRRMDVR
ncbi:MAG: universal stress protein [Candidatus Velthaea sp.]